MSADTQPAAVAAGDRSVALGGSAENALIITGDRNTVHMRLGGVGAVLAFAFRWNRPRRRRRRERRHACPPRFADHVDRDDEIGTLVGNDGAPRAVNLYGEAGVGKTHVLVEALNHRECRMRHGTMYLDGRDRAADDLLHAVFDELYECRVPRRDLRIERLLAGRRAVVAFEDVEIGPEDAQRLLLGAPRCRFFVTSARRVLYEGTPLKLAGLPREHAAALAELELGRALSAAEQQAAESIADALHGHPLRLRQAFGRARDEGEGRTLDELAPSLLQPPGPEERLAALTPAQQRVARALAVHAPASVGADHLTSLAGEDAGEVADELEARHDARSHSPRYSLTGALAAALPDSTLEAETGRALAHFTAWAEARQGDPGAVLSEGGALLALLERGDAAGRAAEVIRLGRAIEGAYAWGRRWAAWGRVLDRVLASARRSGDRVAEGWALHQLGTRAYGLGQQAEARALLQEALDVREQIRDEEGAAATQQNLRVVSGRATFLQRLSHLSLAVVAITAVLLIGAGGAAGIIGGDGDAGGGGGGKTAQLAVALDGGGRGSVASDPGDIRCGSRCEADLPLGTEVVLRPSPVLGSKFVGWRARGLCAGTAPCRLRLATDARVIAVFEKVQDPRRLAVTVDGRGTVVSRPAGIRCPRACRMTFEDGRLVRLTATAGSGYRFAGWSGDCDGTAGCEIRLDRARSVGAQFVADRGTATLGIDKRGDGDGVVTSRPSGIDCGGRCEASFPQGSTVTLTVRAAEGSVFRGWSGEDCRGRSSCEVTLDGDRRVIARFGLRKVEPGTERLTVDHSGKGQGSVTSDPSGIDCGVTCEAEFPADGKVVLTADADEGSEFAGWSGGGCSGTGTCTVTLDGALTVTASFDPAPPDTFTLTTHTAGDGSGVVRPDCAQGCPYDAGRSVRLIAKPRSGSEFTDWSGDCSGAKNVCSVRMTEDRDVTATFIQPEG